MSEAVLEHVNVTVQDADATAALLQALFGWRVRWAGLARNGGRTVHVGGEHSYVAVHSNGATPGKGRLNHLAVVVDDLDAVEARAKAAGLEPFNHGDYEPGRRFYILDPDGIEYEIVSYA